MCLFHRCSTDNKQTGHGEIPKQMMTIRLKLSLSQNDLRAELHGCGKK